MSNDSTNPTLVRAATTLQHARRLSDSLKTTGPQRSIAMAPRQTSELVRFIEAFSGYFGGLIEKASDSGSTLALQSVAKFQISLEEAIQFVELSFVNPRTSGGKEQALEAADWMCVEGYNHLYGGEDSDARPIGPLVAVDSRRSPAVWSPDTRLPLPSLFQLTPVLMERIDFPGANDRKLASFPLICLPSDLVGDPGAYTLLSHEVGHSLDSVKGYTKSIVAQLAGKALSDYWSAWMREIVADLVGIILSGDAYVLAFCDYVRWLPVGDSVSASESYPGITLRIQLLRAILAQLKSPGLERPDFEKRIFDSRDLANKGKVSQELLEAFPGEILPIMLSVLGIDERYVERWVRNQKTCWQLAEEIVAGGADKIKINAAEEFRFIFSAMELTKLVGPKANLESTWKQFEALHLNARQSNAPAWITSAVGWSFTAKFLPTLRPTFLAADGTKVPPSDLLIYHQHVTFVGATNGQLVEIMERAFQERREKLAAPAWRQIELFSASDTLLKSVERHDGADLVKERNEAEKELRDFLASSGAAVEWAIYRFDGAPNFASFWDWNELGGRIHISSQIMGIDIRRCPSFDHIWQDEVPAKPYECYRSFLKTLRKGATRLAASGSYRAEYE